MGHALDADAAHVARRRLEGLRPGRADLPEHARASCSPTSRRPTPCSSTSGCTRWTSRTTPLYGSQWSLPRSAPRRAGTRRRAARPSCVAVIDTGVDITHPDLAGRLWTNPGEIPANGIDDDVDGLVDDVAGWNFADNTAQLYSAAGRREPRHARRGHHRRAPRQLASGVAGRGRQRAHHAAQVPEARRRLHLRRHGRDRLRDLQGREGHQRLVGRRGLLAAAVRRDPARRRRRASSSSRPPATPPRTTTRSPTWPANCPASSLVSVAATTSTDGLASFSNFGAVEGRSRRPGRHHPQHRPGRRLRLQVGHVDGGAPRERRRGGAASARTRAWSPGR